MAVAFHTLVVDSDRNDDPALSCFSAHYLKRNLQAKRPTLFSFLRKNFAIADLW